MCCMLFPSFFSPQSASTSSSANVTVPFSFLFLLSTSPLNLQYLSQLHYCYILMSSKFYGGSRPSCSLYKFGTATLLLRSTSNTKQGPRYIGPSREFFAGFGFRIWSKNCKMSVPSSFSVTEA